MGAELGIPIKFIRHGWVRLIGSRGLSTLVTGHCPSSLGSGPELYPVTVVSSSWGIRSIFLALEVSHHSCVWEIVPQKCMPDVSANQISADLYTGSCQYLLRIYLQPRCGEILESGSPVCHVFPVKTRLIELVADLV